MSLSYFKPISEFPRFWSKVNFDGPVMPGMDTPCWEWMACKRADGYGKFGFNGKSEYAHRVAFELLHGGIPDGTELDHLCRNHSCIRHLEPVTHQINLLRGDTLPARQSKQTHCKRGHALSISNVRVDNGMRRCRKCDRDRKRIERRLAKDIN